MANQEKNFRVELLNSFLKTPHRRKEAFKEIHRDFLAKDPSCYAHLAAWYFDNQDIRDHKELFIAHLVTNTFDLEYRDVGLALLRDLPPYQVARVVQYIKEELRTVPTALKTEVTRYLRERESNPSWFDSSILHGRKHMKYLYATLRIKPGGQEVEIDYRGQRIKTSYADAILFKKVYPKESILPILREITQAEKEKDIAKLLVKNNIPFRVAVGLIKEVTPMIMVAMLNNMSPQDVINHLGMLKRYGCMNNEDVKTLIMEKLEAAKDNKRVHTMKTKVAAQQAGVDKDIEKALTDVADTKIQQKGKITRPTAILVDKSGSMENAVEVGKNLAAIVSAIIDADFYVYAFDEMAKSIISKDKELSAWEKAFKPIIANGGTSIGCGIKALTKKQQYVESIIIITDEQENRAPIFIDAYKEYAEIMGVSPTITILRVQPRSRQIIEACERNGVEYSVFEFNGDYYSLQEIVPLLIKPSTVDLLEEIMEYPLPQRKGELNCG